MSNLPAGSIRQNRLVGGAEPTEGNKKGPFHERTSFEDEIVRTSVSGSSLAFDYTLAKPLSGCTADRRTVAALIRKHWLRRDSGVRISDDSFETAHMPTPTLTWSRSSASGVGTWLIGAATVAGLAYIFTFDSSSPDIAERSALVATFGETRSHTPAPPTESPPPVVNFRGIDTPPRMKATIDTEYQFPAPSLQASTRSGTKPNDGDVTALQSKLDSESRISKSGTIVTPTRSSLGVSTPDVGKMPPMDLPSASVKPSIDGSPEPRQRLGGVQKPPDLITLVESESQIVQEIQQAVPLPRAYPKLRPKSATTAPVRTSKLSSLRYDGIARPSASSGPGAKPELAATDKSNQAPPSAAAPTGAPSATGQNPAASSKSANPPAASNWWRELLALFETP